MSSTPCRTRSSPAIAASRARHSQQAEGLLAARTRSGLVETMHDGAVAVVTPDTRRGRPPGDIDQPFYLRSAAKPFPPPHRSTAPGWGLSRARPACASMTASGARRAGGGCWPSGSAKPISSAGQLAAVGCGGERLRIEMGGVGPRRTLLGQACGWLRPAMPVAGRSTATCTRSSASGGPHRRGHRSAVFRRRRWC